MNRTTTACLAIPVAIATFAEGLETASADEAAGPNILWIIAEDLSPDVGCFGQPIVKTPQIDRLAQEGVRFTRVHWVRLISELAEGVGAPEYRRSSAGSTSC